MSSSSAGLRWPSMAALVVGGMVGGGIYVALGVVVEAAGRWTWLAFVIAGVVAISTAEAYAALSNEFETGGGAFAFLEHVDRRGLAGSLSWVMLIAYTLTLALYAFAFGQYVSNAVGGSAWLTRGLSIAVLTVLTAVILAGAGTLTRVEIVIVSANLLALLALALWGLTKWDTASLSPSDTSHGPVAALSGAAAIFVSYEGFQLLTYDYDDLEDPARTLRPVLVWSSVVVVAIYVLVALGATMVLGADGAIAERTVALASAGDELAGPAGLAAMTVAAAFATAAAINSTLFSTAKLAERVSDDGELPGWVDHENSNGVPDRAVMAIAVVAAVLAVTGSLSSLVEAASLTFLGAFAVVDGLALRRGIGRRWLIGVGALVGIVVGVVLIVRLARTKPIALSVMAALAVACFGLRPWLVRLSTD